MPWSIRYDSKADLINDARGDGSAVDGELNAGEKAQVTAARESALALIATGELGDQTRDYVTRISGHANPNHAPIPGQVPPFETNDAISVSVRQKGAA